MRKLAVALASIGSLLLGPSAVAAPVPAAGTEVAGALGAELFDHPDDDHDHDGDGRPDHDPEDHDEDTGSEPEDDDDDD